jgi:hypothetical protein
MARPNEGRAQPDGRCSPSTYSLSTCTGRDAPQPPTAPANGGGALADWPPVERQLASLPRVSRRALLLLAERWRGWR